MGKTEGKSVERSHHSYRLLGLAFWQAWWMLAMCTDTVLSFDSDLGLPLRPALTVMLLTTVGYLLVVLLSARFSPYLAKNSILVVAALSTTFGTLAMSALAHTPVFVATSWLYLLATTVLSVGNALLLIMWGELWSTLSTGRVGRYLFVSYAFAFALYFCVVNLPFAGRAIVTALLPSVSVLILANARQEPRRKATSLTYDLEPFSKARIIVAVIIVSITFGFSQAALALLSTSPDSIEKSFILAGVCIAALALNIIATAPRLEPLSFYRPIVPALVGGLILMVLLQSDYFFIGSGLVILAIYCLDMLIMLVTTDLAFRMRTPVALTFGLTIIAARCGTLVGTVGFDVASDLPIWNADLPQQILLGCAIVALVAGTLLFSEADLLKLYRLRVTTTNHSAPVYERCQQVSDTCGLTSREMEVLVLLAAGRSIPFICQELSIAQGTAKHHVSNIYRKLGVGDRQGLHDVIELGNAGKGAL